MRPTKFSIDLMEKMLVLYKAGSTDAEVARFFKITERTIFNWKRKHPEFFLALRGTKGEADGLVEHALFRRAVGASYKETKVFCSYGDIITHEVEVHCPPDTGACALWLKNRQPERWRESLEPPVPINPIESPIKKTFVQFCVDAGYPEPFAKQIEMMEFAFDQNGAKLILGSRGYGKTDYVTILGVGYKLYLNPERSFLIITKSKERNAAILREIHSACEKNGMSFEKNNSSCLRVSGKHGKDHSVSTVTIKTVTLRGRHPDDVLMDDPVTPDDASEATRLHVKRVYNEVNKLCGNVVIIGQPVHKYDLYADLRPLLNKMEVPHGTIPELDHDLEAQRLAGVDEASIQASYFLNVLSEGTTPFDKVRYINEFIPGDSVAFIDPSFEGGDYTAISILRAYMGGVAVVGFTFKKAWNHCLDEMAPHLTRFNVKRICFETNSLGEMPVELLRKTFPSIGVTGRKSNGNKHSRIMAAGAYAHLIHLSKQSDKIYLDQVVKYEYKSKFDDAPDSLASCLEWIGLTRGKL